MNIATVASDTVWKDTPANIAKHQQYINEVMKRWPATDFILFPEISLMGFVTDQSNQQVAESLDGESVTAMCQIAKTSAVAVCFGIIEKNQGGLPFNTQVVVSKQGEIFASYRKNHLFTQSDEPKVFCAGSKLVTFELHGWKCGLSTCFDIRFPRLFEAYKRAGVELMLSGFNWVDGRNKPDIMTSLVKARAHENQYFFAAVDRSGSDPNTSYYGTHIIANPYAENIAQVDGPYGYAELRKEEIAQLSASLPLSDSYKDEYVL